jgi:hypothetical protein
VICGGRGGGLFERDQAGGFFLVLPEESFIGFFRFTFNLHTKHVILLLAREREIVRKGENYKKNAHTQIQREREREKHYVQQQS